MACCYFPTTVMFLDDKEDFLKNLSLCLDETLVYRMFSHPETAKQFLLQERDFNSQKHNWLIDIHDKHECTGQHAHHIVDFDISKIYKGIYSLNKFREISVIVLDYVMPGMSGLEFARWIKRVDNNLIKILMLTGEADEQLAVEAFNEGIINRFIKKGSPMFENELNNAINNLQFKYFCDLTKNLVTSLSVNENCALNDPSFVDFFKELIWKNNFVEYYLVDEFGSFLLLDIFGNSSWIVVKSDNIVDQYYHIAEDDYAPETVKEALAKREKIPFFFTQKDMETSVDTWENYLHPAQKLVGKKNEYYVAFIKSTEAYDIHSEKIVSYKKYLDALAL